LLTGHRAEFTVTDSAGTDVHAALLRALDASSEALIGPIRPRLLVIPIRDDDGAVVGGLWGHTLLRWLHVELLIVPESRRGQGIGGTLLTLAEAEARDRGCIGVHLTTFSFQAAPFYEKRGYARFGTLADDPPGHGLIHLSKRLDIAADREAEARQALGLARRLAVRGEDDAAKQAYVDVLRIDAANYSALSELGALALGTGHRSAARTAFAQAVRFHPGNSAGRVNLANLLLEDGEVAAARAHFAAALVVDPALPEAHQGMARVLTELGEDAGTHWHDGFAGHAVVVRPFRGVAPCVPLLLLVSARGGNIPTRHWIDEHRFRVTAIHADYHDLTRPLPPHDLVVNAIGDADLCGLALARAETMLTDGTVPVINPPARVRATGRVAIALSLAGIPGVVAPRIVALSRARLLAAEDLRYPLLLRAPGFHTGRHFVLVSDRDGLGTAIAGLPGDALLAIEYLNARGRDGLARKYRVMFIGGVMHPLHLAISADWKVHYATSAMAANAAHRAEEAEFLNDVPGVLGARAMTALGAIGEALELDYAGVDFALGSDGSMLIFEANATMVIAEPGAGAMWDYRRAAIGRALAGARGLLR
jgi:GNAT superfamily N-acetyltransferase